MFSILLVLGGCGGSGTIKTDGVIEETGIETNDTGEIQAPKEADLSVWIGERVFITDDCEEPAIEEGHELTAENWDGYEEAHNECPNCDRIYYVAVSPETICGYPVTQVRYRGVDFMENDEAIVYDFSEWSGASIIDPNATFDGSTLSYEYEYSGSLAFTGTVNYPEVE
jgi:hypothetical protein